MGRRVVLLGHYPPPFGGIGTHVRFLVPYLLERGYEVDVVSSGREAGREQHDGFAVHRLTPSGRGAGGALLRRGPRMLRDFARTRVLRPEFLKAQAICGVAEPLASRADLVCAYHLTPWALAASWIRASHGVPFVCVNFGEIYHQPRAFRQMRGAVRYITRQASALASVSQHCARSLQELDIHDPVRVIPIGVETERFREPGERPAARARLELDEHRPVVLFLGRMIRDMGLHTLLDAVPSCSQQATFIVAGARGHLTEDAVALSKQLGPGRVLVLPDVPFDELPGLYAASDLVVAPSPDNRACMGLAIKEGMATGRAIVACRAGGVPEAVADGETGWLVPPEDPEQLARAVDRALDSPQQCRAMGEAGRRRAEELFDVHVTNRRFEELFREVLA